MKCEELDKIIAESPELIREQLGKLYSKIVEAAAVVLEESQDSESGKATVSIGLSLKIDLTRSPVEWHVEAAVGVRHKVKSDTETADVSPKLPGM